MNENIFKLTLIVILWVVVNGLLADLGLWLMGQPTISDWLRSDLRWFYWPAAITVGLLLLLWLHLKFTPMIWH